MEENITEKFALLNLLQAISGLSAVNETDKPENKETVKPPEPPKTENFNAMANVLARHEEIANRVRNRK